MKGPYAIYVKKERAPFAERVSQKLIKPCKNFAILPDNLDVRLGEVKGLLSPCTISLDKAKQLLHGVHSWVCR